MARIRLHSIKLPSEKKSMCENIYNIFTFVYTGDAHLYGLLLQIPVSQIA